MVGCVTTVTPPASARDPVSVFLVDHGRTPSLVLPAESGGAVRYAYGDWAWYARRRTGSGDALRALFVESEGTLGRRELATPATARGVREGLEVGIEHLYEIRVERGRAAALRRRLEGLYEANLATEVNTPSVGLSFVRHPEPYTARHNSNTVAAGWLRELGCRVEGPALVSRWRIEGADR